ncbi:MAG: tRNA pseudouridine(38-40) synthase TruA [Eubacterium sp.]|nr:tRNA pseudouridine(38-40) synthase TruA [Eubacterium sp.]
MKRILLIIAYDGTDYAGWQRQDNALTVEEILEDALTSLTGEAIDIAGASRTDAGVHAYGNVAVFDTDSPIPPERFAIALNSYLPDAIRVTESMVVPDDFHPRYAESEKTYQYHILNTKIPLPTMSRYAHHVYEDLDVDAMRSASSCLIGEHDFTAFCSAGSQVKSKVRTIYSIDIDVTPLYEESEDYDRDICIRITGNGFLYNMVRIIAGTLIEVGLGRFTPERVEQALTQKKRDLAGPTAPAKGLFLEMIDYLPL